MAAPVFQFGSQRVQTCSSYLNLQVFLQTERNRVDVWNSSAFVHELVFSLQLEMMELSCKVNRTRYVCTCTHAVQTVTDDFLKNIQINLNFDIFSDGKTIIVVISWLNSKFLLEVLITQILWRKLLNALN